MPATIAFTTLAAYVGRPRDEFRRQLRALGIQLTRKKNGDYKPLTDGQVKIILAYYGQRRRPPRVKTPQRLW